MKKKIGYLLVIMIFIIALPLNVFAHSGRTDSNGGHRDNKNKSGLGSYHYHCGGHPPHLHNGGVCPYDRSTAAAPTPAPKRPSISLKKYPEKLYIGESSGLEFSIKNSTDRDATITSSNPDVLMVNSDNTLTAVSAGTSKVTISTSETTASFTVTVKAVPVEKVEITNKVDKIQLGESYQLENAVFPDNATDQSVTWSSSDDEIVSISKDGEITAVSAGKVTVTCQAKNKVKDMVKLEIYEVFPEEIVTDIDEINLEIGKDASLDIQILPENANDKSYKIEAVDDEIIKIADDLVVDSVNEGNTKLMITACNGITKEIPVTVYHNPVERVVIDDSEIEYVSGPFSENSIDIEDKLCLSAAVEPAEATFKEVRWESSNPDIIAVEDDEFIIKGTGNVTLTAYAHDEIQESIDLNVVNKGLVNGMIGLGIMGCAAVGGVWVYKKKPKKGSAL